MKYQQAILTGSISQGFSISQVVADTEVAKSVVAAHLANGLLAEAIDIRRPSSLSKGEQDYDTGSFYVVFGSGLGDKMEMYGPFPDFQSASGFGEDNDRRDQWYTFEFDTPTPVHPVEHST